MCAMEFKDHRKNEAGEKGTPPHRPPGNAFPQSPPSSSSSPAHDFEFTISLCPSRSDNPHRTPSSSFDIDLSPADDLFYQGHLLPLHHHLFSTPRSSCSCIPCSSTPPEAEAKTDAYQQYHHHQNNHVAVQADHDKQPQICDTIINDRLNIAIGVDETKMDSETHINSTRTKPKSFSLLTLKKGSKLGLKSAKEVIERYVKMVKPFFMRKSKEAEDERRGNLGRQRWNRHPSSHSFSNQRYSRSSAPCSAMTSPGNSGILCAIPSSNESTMEDLQNAIQAAIAHCKNSIAVKEDRKIDA